MILLGYYILRDEIEGNSLKIHTWKHLNGEIMPAYSSQAFWRLETGMDKNLDGYGRGIQGVVLHTSLFIFSAISN